MSLLLKCVWLHVFSLLPVYSMHPIMIDLEIYLHLQVKCLEKFVPIEFKESLKFTMNYNIFCTISIIVH